MWEIPGMASAQAAYDAMEPPYEAECECPELWVCPDCGDYSELPGACTECEDDGPDALRELTARDDAEDDRLASSKCPVHRGFQCGDDRCRECG